MSINIIHLLVPENGKWKRGRTFSYWYCHVFKRRPTEGFDGLGTTDRSAFFAGLHVVSNAQQPLTLRCLGACFHLLFLVLGPTQFLPLHFRLERCNTPQDILSRAPSVNIRDVGGSTARNSLHLVVGAGGVMGFLLCAVPTRSVTKCCHFLPKSLFPFSSSTF